MDRERKAGLGDKVRMSVGMDKAGEQDFVGAARYAEAPCTCDRRTDGLVKGECSYPMFFIV